MLAWHKTATTSEIQQGVETAIAAVVKKAGIPSCHVDSIKIGTTVGEFLISFVNSWKLHPMACVEFEAVAGIARKEGIGIKSKQGPRTMALPQRLFNLKCFFWLHGSSSDVL